MQLRRTWLLGASLAVLGAFLPRAACRAGAADRFARSRGSGCGAAASAAAEQMVPKNVMEHPVSDDDDYVDLSSHRSRQFWFRAIDQEWWREDVAMPSFCCAAKLARSCLCCNRRVPDQLGPTGSVRT